MYIYSEKAHDCRELVIAGYTMLHIRTSSLFLRHCWTSTCYLEKFILRDFTKNKDKGQSHPSHIGQEPARLFSPSVTSPSQTMSPSGLALNKPTPPQAMIDSLIM